MPEHYHESEQITYILEGALKFELEGKEIVVNKGEVLRIPSTFRIAPWRSKIPSISTFSARSATIGSRRTTPTCEADTMKCIAVAALSALSCAWGQTPPPDGIVSPEVHKGPHGDVSHRAPKWPQVTLYGDWMPVER